MLVWDHFIVVKLQKSRQIVFLPLGGCSRAGSLWQGCWDVVLSSLRLGLGTGQH